MTDTDIRINLPLPLDISGTLIQIIGLTYPGAVIKNDSHTWDHQRQLVISIPGRDRHKTAKKAEKYAKAKAHLHAESDATLTELGPGGVSFGLPEYLSNLMLTLGKAWVEQYPDAKNYIESEIRDRETGKRWVFTIARSDEQTPHKLRLKAEAERDTLKAELDQLKAAQPHSAPALNPQVNGNTTAV